MKIVQNKNITVLFYIDTINYSIKKYRSIDSIKCNNKINTIHWE